MTIKTFFQIAFLLFVCFTLQAQNKLVGKIVDQDKQPITNAKIIVNDEDVEATINQRGYFEVEVPEGVKEITIYSPGYGFLTSEYTGERNMSFVFLKPKKPKELEKKVSIGYGEVSKEALTYAVEDEDYEKEPPGMGYRNIYDMIRGRFAGVTVTPNNKIIIRGQKTLLGSTDPLFIFNGMIVSTIDNINPNDVKDITILKDAAASMYGSRGANGVIMIESK